MIATGQPDSRPARQPVDQPAYMDSTQAARALGISLDALRKRIARGTIEAVKEAGHWYVRWPDNQPAADRPTNRPPDQNHDGKELAAMEARIESLETQLATKDTQIDQLHHLLAQTALNQAPGRPWWKIW